MANTVDNMNLHGVSYFKFDESSGNITDSKGTALGTINGGVTRVTGYNGQGSALNFNGTNGYVQFNQKVIPVGKKSIRFRIRKNGYPPSGSFQSIVSNASGVTHCGFQAILDSTSIYVQILTGTGNWNTTSIANIKIESTLSNVCDNQWHTILFTWDGLTGVNNAKLYIDDMLNPKGETSVTKLEVDQPTNNLVIGADGSTKQFDFFYGQIDNLEIYNEVISPISDKTLIYHQGIYKYYKSNLWQSLGSTVTQDDYINYGMEDLSNISEVKWSELTGEIETHTWTDFQPKKSIEVNIETKPFTLLEEWDGKQIQIIEYTDNPTQAESSVTLETEPFTLEDYLEEATTLDILTYTDDETHTPVVSHEIGYSRIDNLSNEFEIIAFNESEVLLADNQISMNAVPAHQFLFKSENILFYGDFQKFITSITSQDQNLSKIRFLLSFDNGLTWKSFRHNKWKSINSTDKFDVLKYGMRVNDINSISKDRFDEVFNNGMRIGYYIEERVWTSENEAINVATIHSNAYVDDIKISNLLFFVVNTIATINADVAGNKILGSITDEDLGKVQYRVKLNGEYIYPVGGVYTPLNDTPIDFDAVTIDNRKIILGANNTIQVEFKDGWGHVESWSTSFIGKPVGLIFSTPSGQYYSNAFGEIVRYLNFGTMIAGQTTLEEKIVLSNTLPFTVKDITLTTDTEANGVEIQLSKTNTPFVAQKGLIYSEELATEETVNFYVRLKLNENAVGNHLFDINASADPA